MGAIRQAVRTVLTVASGHLCDAHPNNHIWLLVPGHSKGKKVQTKKVVFLV